MSEPTGGPGPKPTDEVLNAVALATSAVAKGMTEQAEARARPTSKRDWQPLVATVLVVAALVAWLAFPPTVDDADPRSAARVEMDLKMGIASLAQQVENYRVAKGALPSSLEEAGAEWPGVTYVRLDQRSYELTGTDHAATVIYHSSQPLADFSRGLSAAGVRP